AVVEGQRNELEQLVAEDAVPFGLGTAHVRHCNEIDVLEADVADRDLRGAEHRTRGEGASRPGCAYLADLGQAEFFGQRRADPPVPLRAGIDREPVGALAADRHLDHRDRRRQDRHRGAVPGNRKPRNVLRRARSGQHKRRPGKHPTDPHHSPFPSSARLASAHLIVDELGACAASDADNSRRCDSISSVYLRPMRLLDKMLSPLLKRGELAIIDPSGKTHRYGSPDPELRPVTVRLTDNRAALQIVRDPALGTVETWMDDRLQLVEGEIIDLILLIRRNSRWEERTGRSKFKKYTGRIRHFINTYNRKADARRNVVHHYDIGNAIYRTFLDPDMQYSCGYFTDPGNSIEQAQLDKK